MQVNEVAVADRTRALREALGVTRVRVVPLLGSGAFPPELAAVMHRLLGRSELLAIDDTSQLRGGAPPLLQWIERAGIRALLALPLRDLEGTLLGFLLLEEVDSPRFWSETERGAGLRASRELASLLSESAPVLSSPLPSPTLWAGQTLQELLRAVEIQSGYLTLLEEELEGANAEERSLMAEIRSAAGAIVAGANEALGLLEGELRGREEVELGALLASWLPRLSLEVGDGVRLRIAPTATLLPVAANPGLLQRALLLLLEGVREAGNVRELRLSWGPAPAESGLPGGSESGAGMARLRIQGWPEGREDSSRLPKVAAIVEGHGGAVRWTPDPGGSALELLLPLRGAAAPPRELHPPLLLVEDDPLLARLLRRILERKGFTVLHASDSESARLLWQEREGRIAMALVELRLPGGVRGEELALGWRRERSGRPLPLLLLDRHAPAPEGAAAGALDPEGRGRGESAEGVAVLRRPFEPAEVLLAVREELGRVEGPRVGVGPEGGADSSSARRIVGGGEGRNQGVLAH